jgi:hypothetical protein
VAWSRAAKRWGELTNPASRTDPTLVAAASEVRAATAAAATNPTGWATPDQLTSRVDLPKAVRILHLSMVASVDIAYVIGNTAADHPGLTAPARIIGMRAQGETEIAIEQGETRYEGVTWTTRSQIAADQLIPLPEPARRGLITLADDVITTTKPGCRRGCPSRRQQPHAIDQVRPSDVPRTLIRVPSDQPPTKSSAKRTTPVILPVTARAGRGSRCWRRTDGQRFRAPGHEVATRQKPQWRF